MRLRDFLKESFDLIEVSDFFTEEECKQFIQQAEEGIWRDSTLGSRKVQTCDFDLHRIDRKIGEIAPKRIKNWHYRGIYRPSYQIFRYCIDDSIPEHYDKAAIVSNKMQSLFTVVVYLDECQGGLTSFPEKHLEIQPKRGKGVVFPQNLLHWSTKIISGTKFILRAQTIYENKGDLEY